MKLTILLATCLLITTGCVTFEAPDNLVSDTVQVGKDIYRSVKDGLSGEKQTVFESSYVAQVDESYSTSSGKCIDSAIESAKVQLNMNTVVVKKTDVSVSHENGVSVFSCNISI